MIAVAWRRSAIRRLKLLSLSLASQLSDSWGWDHAFITEIVRYEGSHPQECMRIKCLHRAFNSPCKKKILHGAVVWWISKYEYNPSSEERGYIGQYCHLACLSEGWIEKILATNPPDDPTVGLITLDDAREILTEYVDGMQMIRDTFGDDVRDQVVDFYVTLVEKCQGPTYATEVPLEKAHTRRNWPGYAVCYALDNASDPRAALAPPPSVPL